MDLSGTNSGFLTYIREAGCTERGSRLIECRCACGNQITCQASQYIAGATRSCGCYAKKVFSDNMRAVGKKNVKVATGLTFYYWTVIERDGDPPNQANVYWICRCKCGTIKSVVGTLLRNGKSKSCGCYMKELLRNRKKTNETS